MIYDNIRAEAKKKGNTIRDIERALFYSNGSLRKWNKRAPSDKLTQVADFLQVDPMKLLGRK